MRSLEFVSPKSLFVCSKSVVSSLSLSFSTWSLPQSEPHQISSSPEVAIIENDSCSATNRAYWSRRIHQLCAVDRDVDQALRLLDELRLRGYRPDPLNLSSIIHGLCDAQRFDEARHRFSLFLSANCVPDERTCNVLIARLLGVNSPQTTLQFIRSLLRHKPEFVPSLMNYNRLIHQFCEIAKPLEAHRLLYVMIAGGHRPNEVSYTTLINGYCKVGQLGDAHKLFEEMHEYGVRTNALSYSTLLRGVLRRRDLEYGKELLNKLWEVMTGSEDMLVNNAAFCSVMDCLCREGLFHEVFKIAEEMPQGKSVLEEFAYGQMMDSLCKYGRFNGAARIVYMMRKRGLTPSLISYNSIIHGLSINDCFRAYQLFEEAIQFGYLPSEFTYKILVEALCREFDIAKAKEVLKIMLNKEGVDRTRIYNIFLGAVSFANNPTEILNVLVSMLQTQCSQPDVITLNTVINGFCKMGKIEEALKVLRDMMAGKFCGPDNVTFTTIMYGLLQNDRAEEALDLLNNIMPGRGLNPGVTTYNAVFRGLLKLGKLDEAMAVFSSMINAGISADCYTYAIIIDGLFENNKLDEAKKFWEDVIWPSKVHDGYVYSAILQGLCRGGKFNEACDFLLELVDCGVVLTNVHYNIAIDGACKSGLKREAYQILGEMRKNGLVPDAVTWRIVDKLHGKAGRQFVEDDRCAVGTGNRLRL